MFGIEFHLKTASGIPYRLMEGYPQGNFEEEDGQVTEKYIIAAENLLRFVKESFSDLSTIYPGNKWNYRPARSWPAVTNSNRLNSGVDETLFSMITKKVSFEPYPSGDKPADPLGADDLVDFEKVLIGDELLGEDVTYTPYLMVTITYGPGKEGTDDYDVLEVNCRVTGEYIQIPSTSNLYWDNAQADMVTDINAHITKVVPSNEWTVKYRRVDWNYLDISLKRMRMAMGKTNSDKVSILRDAPPNTLLFTGFNITSKYNWRKIKPSFELELHIYERNMPVKQLEVASAYSFGFIGTMFPLPPIEWEAKEIAGVNHFYNPDEQKWMKIYDGNNNLVYEQVEFMSLLFGKQNMKGKGFTGHER